jgi:anti-sigma factor RsiW
MKTCQDLEPLFTPYVDGEATAEQRAAIEAHLAACSTCREFADAETHARELVTSCREQLITPAPARLHQKCADLARQQAATASNSVQAGSNSVQAGSASGQAGALSVQAAALSGQAGAVSGRPVHVSRPSGRHARAGWRRWAPLSLLATAALVIIGVFLLSGDRTALAAQLAKDHVSCVGKVGDRAPADPEAQKTVWKQRLGWTVDVPTFSQADDLQFVQLRRCLHDRDVTMAHILYRRHGRLLSLYVMPEPEPNHPELEVAGERTVIWSQGGRTYAVVGANSSAELHELADRFSRVLPDTAAR